MVLTRVTGVPAWFASPWLYWYFWEHYFCCLVYMPLAIIKFVAFLIFYTFRARAKCMHAWTQFDLDQWLSYSIQLHFLSMQDSETLWCAHWIRSFGPLLSQSLWLISAHNFLPKEYQSTTTPMTVESRFSFKATSVFTFTMSQMMARRCATPTCMYLCLSLLSKVFAWAGNHRQLKYPLALPPIVDC